MCDYFALCCGLRRSLGLLRLRGHLRRVLVHCGDGTFDHFLDAAFDGDFHAVLVWLERLKNGDTGAMPTRT